MKAAWDTSVLFYLFSDQDLAKREVIRRLWAETHERFLPYQVVQELLFVLMRKLGLGLEELEELTRALEAEAEIGAIEDIWPTFFDLLSTGEFQFWDAFVVAESLLAGARVLFSEDMQDGRKIGSLTIRNPFALKKT